MLRQGTIIVLTFYSILNYFCHNSCNSCIPECLHSYLLGSEFSISITFLEIIAAGTKLFATLCNSAVVELVLNKPRALLLSPCDKQASTAPANTPPTGLAACVQHAWNFSACFKDIVQKIVVVV